MIRLYIKFSESLPAHTDHTVTPDAVPDLFTDAHAVPVICKIIIPPEKDEIIVASAYTAAVNISKILLFFQ